MMLFKHRNRLEDLRKTGQSATAEILSITTLGQGSSSKAWGSADDDLTTGWIECRMTLRVLPAGQAPFETTLMTRVQTLKSKGGHVPVWYDPNDHSKVVVDYEADVQRVMHATANLEMSTHRFEQRVGLAWTPNGDDIVPIEVTAQAGKGRVTTPGSLGRVLGGSAESALSYVRANAATLLPELVAGWFSSHDVLVQQAYGDVGDSVTAQDGVGVGTAIAAGVISLLGGHIVRTDVALTGGLTSSGEILAITGLAAKARAAKRTSVKRLVVPAGNAHDLPESQRADLEVVFVSDLSEVLRAALGKHRMKDYLPPA
jgi:ATP-dependent Lon protease